MRLYTTALKLSFKRALAYQGSFWLYVLVQALTYLTIPFIYAGLSANSASLAGLPPGYVFLLTGIAEGIALLYDFLIGAGIEEFASRVASGELDYWLALPFRTPLSPLLVNPGVLSLFCLPIPIWLIRAARVSGVLQRPGVLALALLMMSVSLAARAAYGLLYAAASVYLTRVYALGHLVNTLFTYAALPSAVYRGAGKFILTVIIPVALVANVPAAAIVAGRLPASAVLLVVVSAVLSAVGVFAFLRATRAYMSCGG